MDVTRVFVIERALEVNFGDTLAEHSLPAEELYYEKERRCTDGGRLLAIATSPNPHGWEDISFTERDSPVYQHVVGINQGAMLALSSFHDLRALSDGAMLSLFARELVTDIQPQSTTVELTAHFHSLVARWHEERGISSSTIDIVLCSAYQQIIGMGEKALPLIFERLRAEADKPDQWFWALRSITGDDPVPVELWGRGREMSRVWLAWAVERGY